MIVETVQGNPPTQEILDIVHNVHVNRGRGDLVVIVFNGLLGRGCAASVKQYGEEYRVFTIKNGYVYFLNTRRKIRG